MQAGSMRTLRWMRIPGDILFSIGAALFAWFILELLAGHSYGKKGPDGADISLRDKNEERTIALAGR
jgi:nitric oxide reductase subunit B